MQKESDAGLQSGPGRGGYPLIVKDLALKILCDYSLATGRKWQAILKEIFAVTGAQPTEGAPIMTRQDLESWAARKSVLGDQKFKWVYAFLTHPDTLTRPEFARAKDLQDYGNVERVGRVFDQFFTDISVSGINWGLSVTRPLDSDAIETRIESLTGRYTGSDSVWGYCLSLERFRQERFYVAHFFRWPRTSLGDIQDWNVERYSGFCTVGNQIRVFTKGILIGTAQILQLVPRGENKTTRANSLHVIRDSLISESVGKLLINDSPSFDKRIKYSDALSHTIILKRDEDSALEDFVDNFRWSIVL